MHKNVLWIPLIISAPLACVRSGMNHAVTSDAVATAKLIDICCNVLAIVLAPLDCAGATSAYTSVFMLEYCRDVKNPKINTCITTSQIGVLAPIVANNKIITPRITVFDDNTVR